MGGDATSTHRLLPATARGVLLARAPREECAANVLRGRLFRLDAASAQCLRACAEGRTVAEAASSLRRLFPQLDEARSREWLEIALQELARFGLVSPREPASEAAARAGREPAPCGRRSPLAKRPPPQPASALPAGQVPPRLDWVGFELTRRCNLRCPHCYVAGGEPRSEELTESEARGLLCDMLEAGASAVCLSGGEALCRKDLARIMKGGLEDGVRAYSLVTNGLLLDRDRLGRLVECGLRRLEVSLDGASAEENARIRGCDPEAFGHVLSLLKTALDMRLEIAVRTVVHPTTVARFGEMIRLMRREGIPTLHASPLAPAGRARGMRITAPREDWLAFLAACEEARAAGAPELGLDCGFGLLPWSLSHSCVAGTATGPWYVTASGDVFPCPALAETPFSLGNVREASFGNLIRSVPPEGALPRVPREAAIGRCRTCVLYPRCGGGCRILTYRATGNFLASPPTCLPWIASTAGQEAELGHAP